MAPNPDAREIAEALGGCRSGDGWMAHCPAHDDKKPSLSISESWDGKPLVHCHAGCAQEDVIAKLQDLGLWPGQTWGPLGPLGPLVARALKGKVNEPLKKRDNIKHARAIWHEAQHVRGTLTERYLRARGYHGPLPKSLRFHPAIWHSPSQQERPALVAKVTLWPDRSLVGVQRIYLSRWKPGEKAAVDDEKMSLGLIKGGAVRLGKARDELLIGEGIETTLCASEMAGLPGWSALGSWNFEYMILPPRVRHVIIAADHDEVGKDHAYSLRAKLKKKGISCIVVLPPKSGQDWADVAVLNQ